MPFGTVRLFNDIAGSGFIDPDDGSPSLRVSYRAIVNDGYKILHERQRVAFEVRISWWPGGDPGGRPRPLSVSVGGDGAHGKHSAGNISSDPKNSHAPRVYRCSRRGSGEPMPCFFRCRKRRTVSVAMAAKAQ